MSTVVEGLDWTRMTEDMNELGCALTSPILTPEQCAEFVSMFEQDELFRSTIDMARYRFGKSRYRYFANPVPEPVARLRAAFWPHLLPIARDWADKLGRPAPWPEDFSAKAPMRHGVSVLRSGHRHTLAPVLHDAA